MSSNCNLIERFGELLKVHKSDLLKLLAFCKLSFEFVSDLVVCTYICFSNLLPQNDYGINFIPVTDICSICVWHLLFIQETSSLSGFELL